MRGAGYLMAKRQSFPNMITKAPSAETKTESPAASGALPEGERTTRWQTYLDHRDATAIHLPPAQIANGQVIVAELDGKVAGFAAVVGGELDGLFVEPHLWRRGVGAALVEKAVHEARNRGLALTVTANPAALGFYERCGFTIEGETQTRFGPGLRMSR